MTRGCKEIFWEAWQKSGSWKKKRLFRFASATRSSSWGQRASETVNCHCAQRPLPFSLHHTLPYPSFTFIYQNGSHRSDLRLRRPPQDQRGMFLAMLSPSSPLGWIAQLTRPSCVTGSRRRRLQRPRARGCRHPGHEGRHQEARVPCSLPLRQDPAFKGTDGFTLTESKAISRYSTYLCFHDRPGSTHPAWLCRSPCTSSRSLPLAGPAATRFRMMRLSFTVIPVRIFHVEDTSSA